MIKKKQLSYKRQYRGKGFVEKLKVIKVFEWADAYYKANVTNRPKTATEISMNYFNELSRLGYNV
jgi:hypothetical protein